MRPAGSDPNGNWPGERFADNYIGSVFRKRGPSDLFMTTIVERFVRIPYDDRVNLGTKRATSGSNRSPVPSIPGSSTNVGVIRDC